MFCPTAASKGKKTVVVDATPVTNGTAWFESGENHKGEKKNLLVVASKEHPRPASGRFFRLHTYCGPYRAKKEIEAALKRAAKESTDA